MLKSLKGDGGSDPYDPYTACHGLILTAPPHPQATVAPATPTTPGSARDLGDGASPPNPDIPAPSLVGGGAD